MRAAELLLDERAPRLAVAVRDRHAARIVDQHGDEILLRHGRLEDQGRSHQAEQQHRERRQAQADEHQAVARTIERRQTAVGQHRGGRERHRAGDDEEDRPRQPPRDVTLPEHQWRIFEQETEKRFHR